MPGRDSRPGLPDGIGWPVALGRLLAVAVAGAVALALCLAGAIAILRAV